MPSCGAKMKRNGKTRAGSQRWRCTSCGASSVHGNNTDARELKAFLGWLLSRNRQCDMPGGGRTFRRRMRRFWGVWPVREIVDEVHRAVYVDGIYVARNPSSPRSRTS